MVSLRPGANDAMKQLLRRVNDDTEADLSSSARYGARGRSLPVPVQWLQSWCPPK